MLSLSDDTKPEALSSVITISTIHGAKGLEWDTVFVAGVCADSSVGNCHAVSHRDGAGRAANHGEQDAGSIHAGRAYGGTALVLRGLHTGEKPAHLLLL